MTEPFTPSRTFRVSASLEAPRASLARAIPRRPRVGLLLGFVLAVAFAALVTPAITAERWLGAHVEAGKPAPITVRVAPFAGTGAGGGYVIARGETPQSADDLAQIRAVEDASPHGPMPYAAFFALVTVLAAIFTHHMRRSSYGRLVRVQLASLTLIAIACIAVKVVLLMTSVSILVIPVALLALVPTIALDRVVGLATGVLAALVISLLAPFDLGVATMMLVQVSVAGLVVSERPKVRLRPVFAAGGIATLFTGLTYPLLRYLTTGHFPTGELDDLVHSAWAAAALGPAIATVLAVPLTPLYQLLVGEITDGNLIHLEDLSHPLLRQIAERSPGTWQHSLAMANMADIAANAIGANGRLVRVGAYFHDLGKSLHPKYFIENIEPGETSPHDQLPPEVSCDAIFAHVTEGILTARRAGLHERIVDFMHMHHGNGVLEYFWAKCREQGNPRDLTIEQFRYPGHPPQSRETAILAICDAVEAASRTIKKPDAAAIDSLVQRIVYGKLHLGQLDESGLSMGDLRRVADALRETIRHANHGRIEYPWQREQSLTGPRLDSLDRPARPDSVPSATPVTSDAITPMVRRTDPEALADTADVKKAAAAAVATGREGPSARRASDDEVVPGARISNEELAIVATSPIVMGGKAVSGLAAGNVDRATLPGTVAPVLRGSGSVPPVDVPASAAVPAPAAPVAPVAAGSVAVAAVASAPIPSANATVLGTGAVSPSPSPSPGSAAPVSATLLGPIDIPRVPRSIPPTDPPRMSQPPLPRIHRTDPPPANPEPDPNATTGPHARTKAATLPPAKRGRAPTVPPIPGALPTPALPTPLAPIETPPGVAPLGTATMVGLASGVHGLAPATATTPTDEDTSAPIDALAAARDSSTPIDLTARKIKTPTSTPITVAGVAPPRTATPPTGTPRVAEWSDPERPFASPPTRPSQLDRAFDVPPTGERNPTAPPPPRTTTGERVVPPPPPAPSRTTTGAKVPPLFPPATPVTQAGVAPPRKPTAIVIDDLPEPPVRATTNTDDASRTDPDMPASPNGDLDATNPRLQLPLPAPPMSNPEIRLPPDKAGKPWARGLAARIDAALDGDDPFGGETPVIAPTAAELRALLGTPDVTRQQSLDELERLHRAASERPSDDDILAEPPSRRPPYDTREVDPDDIESEVELIPPVRRANAIGVQKKAPEKK